MVKLNFESNEIDPCIFVKREFGKLMVVLIYVDDGLIMSNDLNDILNLIKDLRKEFKIKDLGEPKEFLGIGIEI